MNAKLAKHLRKMAHQLCLQPDGTVLPTRRLVVLKRHEEKAREQGHMRGVTAVNCPQSWRGINRWLKRNYHA